MFTINKMTTFKISYKCSHTPVKYFTSLNDMLQNKDEIPYFINKKKLFEYTKDVNITDCNEDHNCEIIFRTVQGLSIVVTTNKNPEVRVIAEI